MQAAVDEQGTWHTISVELAKNILLEDMKRLIRGNPSLGQEELANLAAEKKITSRDPPAGCYRKEPADSGNPSPGEPTGRFSGC